MASPTNFLVWNPSQNNQQTDGTYLLETERTGGATTGIFPANVANKLFYQCTTMVTALAQTMVNKGFEMQDVDLATLVTSLSHLLVDTQFGTGAGTVCQGNDTRLIEPGTKMWFYQNVAPTGWVVDTSITDAVLAIRGGTSSYNVSGGSQAGTWTQPNHLHTGPSHTHTGPSHSHVVPVHSHTTGDFKLEIAHMPSHTHTYGRQMADLANEMYGSGGAGHNNGAIRTTSATGGGASHNHGNTGAGGTGATSASGTGATSASGTANTGASATAATWRPMAQVGIICTKS
jgi:hypothetical protein